jgi:DNA-binding CsgD family transcriptional regulator
MLTPREEEALELIAEGLTNAEIAKRLDITVHAVKFHAASIFRKLGVSNRTEAAVAYLRSDEARRTPDATGPPAAASAG